MLQVRQMRLADLKPWEDNPRANEEAVNAVSRSISTFGFNVPILCDQNQVIIAGHTRWKAAKQLALPTVPVIVLKMSDKERRAFSVADNKTAEIADWDLPKLKTVLAELDHAGINLDELGFSEEELRRYIAIEECDEDEIPLATARDSQTKPGELITLGAHQLLCGDSRYSDMVGTLTQGETIDHVFAGPPYFNQRGYAHWDRYEDYILDMKIVAGNCHDVLAEGGVLVWNIANESSSHHDHTSGHSALLAESGLRYLDTIIWAKRGANYASPRNCHIQRHRCYFPAHQWEALL